MRASDHVVLVGMMGAGKTTVGRILAARLARPHLDSDDLVEAATGRSVSEIFARDGEAAFRRYESEALERALSDPRPIVLSSAGGAVLDPENRRLLRTRSTVVWLRAREATLFARVGSGANRPLLADAPAAALARLNAERGPLYRDSAHLEVDVDEANPPEIAAMIELALVRRVTVGLADRPYDVLVGPGARRQLADVLPERARRAVVVTQAGIGVEVEPGIETLSCTIGDGEAAKSLRTIEDLCRTFSRAGVTRHDVVIAVGGGVVTDAAGFAAACYHRGTDVVHVSTTLLGQVDAAIGGKTGVNIPEGKNLVGAFWQPRAVICDTDTLASLPEREWRSGLGEMAKYAFLGVDDLDRLPLSEQIERCAALKADVVAADEREGGRRMLLNYGHTLAHALEATGFAVDTGEAPAERAEATGALRHGEAVGIGLVFAARLARALGRIDDQRVARHLEIVAGYGLPTEIPVGASVDELVTLMARDKKATDGLTFVLDGPAGPDVVSGVDRRTVELVLREHLAGVSA
jgi:5-deoxy-5-amino-3-dehydroquinate synthase